MEQFEDRVKFITTVERGQEGNEPVEMIKKSKLDEIERNRNIPTGMSFLGSDRSSALDQHPPVYIPAAFTKTRA